MRRPLLVLLILAVACGGGGSGNTTTAPTPNPTPTPVVATVSLSTTAATLQVGSTVTLSASALDASGTTISGKSPAWSSSATGIATVTSAGLVTAVAAGVASITATIDTKTASASITVTANCVGTPLALGEVRTLSGAERNSVCVMGGTAGSEYVLIPYKADTLGAGVPLSFTASNVLAVTTKPILAGGDAVLPGASTALARNRVHEAFEMRLRAQERRELAPLRQSRTGVPRQSNIVGLPVTPTVGTVVSMNINVKNGEACTNKSMRNARVAAVSKNAIILADSAAPAGGFTDADYTSFATTFDTLIFPLDTANFGAPTDIDANGRIVIFFTPAVNALSKDSDGGYIAGFFFSRDLFPTVAQTGFQACAGSNYAEMFYMPVVDAAQQYNKFFLSKSKLQRDAVGTLAHEMQHLISDSRRIYITNADYEETWLGEGMSHIAEELLYYKVSGFAPKTDLALSTITATQAKLDAVNDLQVGNLGNYYDFLSAPENHSPVAANDSLETRGATWALLRYALDQSTSTSATNTRALINSAFSSVANFNSVFATTFSGGLVTAVRQMAVANFTDNASITTDSKYAFPSWNFRSVLPALADANLFPILTRTLSSTAATTVTLRGGGSAYVRFGVGPNISAPVTSASSGGAVPATVDLILVRTK